MFSRRAILLAPALFPPVRPDRLATLDRRINFDIRCATTRTFLGTDR
jgi:hypothetical protein